MIMCNKERVVRVGIHRNNCTYRMCYWMLQPYVKFLNLL
uniref:Uncharacterized protein n=1 Tax=Siphoviridae sp. ctorp6 TaxID=2825673 RepID=A0A8S5PCB1_9CAUD|nr:MAG TPA: hypothetical protein [Siphoviridae sp. ctorp6]